MELRVLGSNSSGNGYILTNGVETLILECGIKFSEVKKSLNFNISTIAGALVSHSHGDHSKYIKEFLQYGVTVLSGKETFKAKGIKHHNAKDIEPLKGYQLGNFKVIPFDLKHDVPCLGYIIDNPDMGRLVFITDTFLCKYKFPDVNHWLIEANYSDEILEKSSSHYKNRVYTSHLSIDTAKGILKANNLSKTGIIILCHLSDGHSNEREFIKQIQEEFGVISVVADKGLTVNLTSVC